MKYGSSLIEWNKLPDLARDLRPPPGQKLFRSLGGSNVIVPSLEGDVKWLKYVDLTREGLAEYNTFVQSSVSGGGPMTVSSAITSSTWTSGGGGDGTYSGDRTAKTPSPTSRGSENIIRPIIDNAIHLNVNNNGTEQSNSNYQTTSYSSFY